MKSIKPGRGPSMMNAITSIFAVLFGIYWTYLASRANMAFALFGVFFIISAVVQAVYNFKNATGKNRYSAFDITNGEEHDPLNEVFSNNEAPDNHSRFCPYCGTVAMGDYTYCNKCGKRLP